MHIPDGFVDVPTALTTGAVSLGVVAFSVRKTTKNMGERTVPLLGVTAAFVFAAQMLNFPVAGGTSGHFLGATFAVALLGPWAASIVLSAVLVIQALGMADGGITALGANVFNMAVVAVFVGFGLFWLLKKLLPRTLTGFLISLAAASWASVVLASVAASMELAVSHTVPLRAALPAMSSVHMVIGLGEALIATTLVAAVLAARPDLVRSFDLPLETVRRTSGRPGVRLSGRGRFWAFVIGLLVVAVALAVFISPFASRSPDGLNSVAADKDFARAATQQPVWRLAPLGGYHFPGLGNDKAAIAVAGCLGTLVIFGLVILLGRLLGRQRMVAGPRTTGVRPTLAAERSADHAGLHSDMR